MDKSATGRTRKDGRAPSELRPVTITCGTNRYAEGSAEVQFGNTRVLTTISVERDVPTWLKRTGSIVTQGWVTAEYGMLPRATHTRNEREASRGKQSGRTMEIQRLIGRSLRAALDLHRIPGLTLRCDCDVLCADGGTRTAAITGAWVALHTAVEWLHQEGLVAERIPLVQVAAMSAGMVDGRALLDLAYEEDSAAEFDLNVIADEALRLVEVQGTAEARAASLEQLTELIRLAQSGISTLFSAQRRALGLLEGSSVSPA